MPPGRSSGATRGARGRSVPRFVSAPPSPPAPGRSGAAGNGAFVTIPAPCAALPKYRAGPCGTPATCRCCGPAPPGSAACGAARLRAARAGTKVTRPTAAPPRAPRSGRPAAPPPRSSLVSTGSRPGPLPSAANGGSGPPEGSAPPAGGSRPALGPRGTGEGRGLGGRRAAIGWGRGRRCAARCGRRGSAGSGAERGGR